MHTFIRVGCIIGLCIQWVLAFSPDFSAIQNPRLRAKAKDGDWESICSAYCVPEACAIPGASEYCVRACDHVIWELDPRTNKPIRNTKGKRVARSNTDPILRKHRKACKALRGIVKPAEPEALKADRVFKHIESFIAQLRTMDADTSDPKGRQMLQILEHWMQLQMITQRAESQGAVVDLQRMRAYFQNQFQGLMMAQEYATSIHEKEALQASAQIMKGLSDGMQPTLMHLRNSRPEKHSSG